MVSIKNRDLYAIAGQEVANGVIDTGLWTKAFADSGGNDVQAKALYLKMRVIDLSSQRDAQQRQLQQQVRIQQQQSVEQQKKQICMDTERKKNKELQYKATSKSNFICYNETPFQHWVRGIINFFCWLVGLIAIVVFLASFTDKNISGFWGGIAVILLLAALLIPSRFSIRKATVKCPECSTELIVPADQNINIRCGNCKFEFPMITSMNP